MEVYEADRLVFDQRVALDIVVEASQNCISKSEKHTYKRKIVLE